MTLLELIKKYGEGKGESAMWPALSAVSESVEESMDADARRNLLRKVYAGMSGNHYNEDFAMEDVSKMYYKGTDGKEHHAPYWIPEATAEELDKLLVDLAVNFLDDPDSKDAGHKIWSYLH